MNNVACLTRNLSVVGSNPIKGSCCFLEQEMLPHPLVLVGFRNSLTIKLWKINVLYGRLTHAKQASAFIQYYQNQKYSHSTSSRHTCYKAVSKIKTVLLLASNFPDISDTLVLCALFCAVCFWAKKIRQSWIINEVVSMVPQGISC